MLPYPRIDPVAVSLGPLKVHWYGIMYLVGFGAAWWLGRRRIEKHDLPWRGDEFADMVFYGALGVLVGGRFGYVLFYNFSQFLDDPLWLFAIWDGGMSFHGGMLGVILALWLFARKRGHAFFDLTDFAAPLTPIGLGAGRLGNFIGGELWGRPTDVPWAMVFPRADAQPRHPSQLYEFALEGVLLFVILWWFTARPRPRMAASGLFLVGYGTFRFCVELFREPDPHLGFLALDWVTMGQLLCVPMILLGGILLALAYTRGNPGDTTAK